MIDSLDMLDQKIRDAASRRDFVTCKKLKLERDRLFDENNDDDRATHDQDTKVQRRRSSASTLPPGINLEGTMQGIEYDVSASRPDTIEGLMIPSRSTRGEMKQIETLKREQLDNMISKVASPRVCSILHLHIALTRVACTTHNKTTRILRKL